jgi:hypothetical protein
MHQYEFEIVNKRTKRVEHARATAQSETIARAQIVIAYGLQFDVMGFCSDINPPHHVLGEIDCSTCDLITTDFLMNKANQIEGITP